MRREELMLNLRKVLILKRSSLRKTLAAQQGLIASNEDSAGDSIDVAVDCEMDEVSSQLAAVESRELAEIDSAFERIRDGLYGICNDCEKPIPIARMQAIPFATRCLKCQREMERETECESAEFLFQDDSELMLTNVLIH